MTSKLLKIKNLSYKDILHEISFNWQQGEIIALMGANGSGKSTLARVVTGLVEASAGAIELYQGNNFCSWEDYPRWREIGFVGQNPRRQTIGASVSEEIAFGLLNTGMEVNAVKARVKELLKSIGMEGKDNQSPATLSGGERQRLVTAAVLGLEPSFIILDEALTMLDQHAQSNILTLLLEARKKTGQLWITHDPELACLADRLLVMKDGHLIEDYPQALQKPEFRQQYGIRLQASLIVNRHFMSIKKYPPAKTDKTPVLEWKSTNFDNRLVLDAKVAAGEFIGILGPSGAGKSTLLESVIGLNRPSEGSFYAYGEVIKKNNLQANRQKSRLVLQEPGEYFIGKSVFDEVFYGEGNKISADQMEERYRFLQEFGISRPMAAKYPEVLSGGEKQRVALAAALHTSPEVLLLDEAMLGLDGPGREQLRTLLWDLKGKTTVLMVTHDLGEILEFADRLWLIQNGRMVFDCFAQDWQNHIEIWQRSGIRYPGSSFAIISEEYQQTTKNKQINQLKTSKVQAAQEKRGAV